MKTASASTLVIPFLFQALFFLLVAFFGLALSIWLAQALFFLLFSLIALCFWPISALGNLVLRSVAAVRQARALRKEQEGEGRENEGYSKR